MQSHKALAQHYYLDALDLHHRFCIHWNNAQRVSSRIKSFVDLLMACECMLKSQCIVARSSEPLSNAYSNVKLLKHNIRRLSLDAEATFPSSAHKLAREYFGKFPVGLRYSADAYNIFFPIDGAPPKKNINYSTTLGNSAWVQEAEEAVKTLIAWGKAQFSGEIDFNDIDSILKAEVEINKVITFTTGAQKIGDKSPLIQN